MTTAIIAGGGPGGLYTAWRLLSDPSKPFDKVNVFEMSSERLGGRIFTKTFSNNGYVDVGGMRFSNKHQIIGKVISELGVTNTTDFVETKNRLYYLRGKHFYESAISTDNPVPYNDDNYNHMIVDEVFATLSKAIAGADSRTRQQWCDFFENGTIPGDLDSFVYPKGANLGNIGYWDLMIDFFGSEAFKYCADAGGYTSNVINWNAADAISYNGEFAGDVKYLRFKGGYTTFIQKLADKVEELGGVIMKGRRLISFDAGSSDPIDCTFRDQSDQTYTISGDALFLAMPRKSVELVRASSASNSLAADLGNAKVRLLLEAVIEQPSYKIAISFDTDWWNSADFPPDLSGDAWGPTITDLPLRQIYYFSPEEQAPDAHSMLASYDDMRFTQFWRELELDLAERRTVPLSLDYQPLGNGQALTDSMKAMVARQLAEVHFSSANTATAQQNILGGIKEAFFMDWSLNPFGAGYHAWAAHNSLCKVMTDIRQPMSSISPDAPVYLVGSAYSNDQAWVEGAFCTSESVLVDYFSLKPIVDTKSYPLICKCK